jgi:hypothetical protein
LKKKKKEMEGEGLPHGFLENPLESATRMCFEKKQVCEKNKWRNHG